MSSRALFFVLFCSLFHPCTQNTADTQQVHNKCRIIVELKMSGRPGLSLKYKTTSIKMPILSNKRVKVDMENEIRENSQKISWVNKQTNTGGPSL